MDLHHAGAGVAGAETRIAGWLMIPAVGMPLSLVIHVVAIVFALGEISDSLSAGLFLAGANAVALALLVRAMPAFYQRRAGAPSRIRDYLIGSMILWGIGTLIAMAHPHSLGGVNTEGEWIVALWGVLILFIVVNSASITYFNRSRRVRQTFTEHEDEVAERTPTSMIGTE